jgi:predicted XRE-type DNA-binding protein
MEYLTEVIDRKTGELVSVSQGNWITVSELGECYGVGRKEIRQVLVKMELLQSEGTDDHTRYRLAPWAVRAGLGKRIERKGKIPFDTISPLGQDWIAARWDAARTSIEDAKTDQVRTAEEALKRFVEERDAFRDAVGRERMTTKEMIHWLVFHFPSLTQSEISQVVHVSQPLVSRILKKRNEDLKELRAKLEEPLRELPRGTARYSGQLPMIITNEE